VVFNFLIGNGDAHTKNFSVLYREGQEIRLASAYDIVCSKLVIPNEEDSALTVNGKKNNLTRSDFDVFADHLEIPSKIRYETFQGKAGMIQKHIESSRLPADFIKRFIEIVAARYERLKLKT
jgi:serine/threonine-protein kinase HipA